MTIERGESRTCGVDARNDTGRRQTGVGGGGRDGEKVIESEAEREGGGREREVKR